jgi:hypothetical protein
MIYLDTHVILWLFARKGEGLSIRAMKLIAQAAIGSNTLVFLSSALLPLVVASQSLSEVIYFLTDVPQIPEN